MPNRKFIERIVVLVMLLVGSVPRMAVADDGSPAAVKNDVAANPLSNIGLERAACLGKDSA